jgi:hypothetical protein
VDPTLDKNFPETEAVRFLKVGLLCVQETAKLRPRMVAVVEMLVNDSVKDAEISPPGLVADFMNIRLRQTHSSATAGSSSSFGMSTLSSVNLGRWKQLLHGQGKMNIFWPLSIVRLQLRVM